MSRTKKGIGAYRQDPATGLAVVTLQSPSGARHVYPLGQWRSHESLCKHERLMAQWRQHFRELPDDEGFAGADRLDAHTQLMRLCEAWPNLAGGIRGAIMFLAGLSGTLRSAARTRTDRNKYLDH